jgi:ABC-type lipoprotein export system ATPase subunit
MATVSATAESGRPRTGARGRRLLVPALFALRRMQAHAQRTVVVAIGIAVGAAVLALTAVGSGAVQDRAVQRGLAPELDARALVGLRLGLLGAPAAECERVADRLLERVGLLDKCRALPAELSGGQQQRVAICAALAHRPRLFIADEPTGELDAANAAQIYALIRELSHEAGVTTIVVSHDPESAAVAGRVVQIRDGRVSGEVGADGAAHAVVNKGGWIRVPEELLRRASFTDRAQLELSGEGILVTRAGAAPQPAPVSAAESTPRARGAVVAETRGLAKTHGRGARATEVFRDLTLEFNAGELSAVTGPSGSGKSTLLHLLAGLDLPSDGEVIVAGTSLGGFDATGRARLRRSHIGLVTQGTDLVPFLSAQESVELSLAFRGVARDEAAVRAAATLADVGLAPLAGQRVARLSMGERQRVALARALAARPALLLADEPTARLDEANARAIGLLFAELARRTETAIVCATHDPVLLEHVATEVPLATVVR